ncbi:MAG: CAP domain-containing protein [Blastocatellia bacterium]|nr:CAP domain-containing protein [Blastocatellia bacterium]MCS7156719.1 CAP domain-containing protein [Blastocatellia bacterium]MCX7751539.1 CAP domain-containing protein [Blastocatellia bacterium]MDW8168639.1 CAP domain-containing protein [Acidobacteriota bacterium]MDW8256534.1 CAP domain-containing protein [Acidobacteriota bacterium]
MRRSRINSLTLGVALISLTLLAHPRARSEGVGVPHDFVRFSPAQLEMWIFEGVNRERALRRLPLLEWDARLAEAARRHSEDMAARRFFGHITPEGEDLSMRVRQIGLTRYRAVAENIALNFDPIYPVGTTIHQWMVSPWHRRNLLGPFRSTGVGVAIAATGAHYVTQIFLDP